MTTTWTSKTNAVFTTDRFDKVWHPDGGDSHPPPGRDFVQALGDAFIKAGFTVAQMSRECHDPNDHWWEHSYWYFYIVVDRQKYFVQLEPFERGSLWRVVFSMSGGFSSIFRSRQSALKMPVSLQKRAESIIQSIAGRNNIRWVTEEDAARLW